VTFSDPNAAQLGIRAADFSDLRRGAATTDSRFDHGRADVLGVKVSAVDMKLSLDLADRWIAAGEPGYICVTGVHGVMEAQKDSGLRRVLNDAAINLPDGMPTAIPGHHLPMAMAGTLMLGVGWLGLTTGMAVTRLDAPLAVAVTNTALASAAAVLAATLLVWWRFGTPDPSLISNGLLAGLVSISAGCVFVSTGAAVFIGLTAGLLVVWSVFLVERHLRVDDPVGAISIHGTCGVWGLLAVGLFANGTYGAGWNGQPGGVTGLFYGGAAQLGAQAIGAVVCVAFVLATVFVLFKALDATVGNRVRPEAEFEGLDVTEMGTIAYPDFSLAPSRHEPAPLFGDRHH